ncbi:MAG: glycosyltransferase family 2 protein [Defluviitaleaceae bacterium]|nr:glycosyltransferase family 2 protein [Defluviitaleaceae bacterium]MCL2261611.1 glycosyltransferase family 2 protein [Defluviitaleaceae bacterium]
MKPQISIVVPVYNEVENVHKLHEEINNVCVKEGYVYEIIFVDDGSSDGTFEACKKLTPLKLIRLRRNFGQTAAMDAGIKAAQHTYIVTMDGDGQNDPADIPNMLTHMITNDLDVVSGWRKKRKDTFFKRFASRGANFLRYIIVKDNIHDSGCSLKVYKKECFENINLYGEMHRFIPALLKIKGFTVGEVVVNHRPRTAGKTKYNWRRTVKGFIDMIAVWFWHKYSVRPLHLLGGIGILMLFLAGISGIFTTLSYIRGQSLTDDFQAFLTLAFIMAGLFLFVCGLLSDVLTKIYYGSTVDSPYSVKDVIDTAANEGKAEEPER